MCKEYIKTQMNIHRQTFLMLMNTINKFEQPNTEQADRRCAFSRSFTRMFDRLCAFLDERIGGASELIDACQSVADRFWHSKLYFPVCFMMLAVFMAVGQPVIGGVLVMSTLIFLLLSIVLWFFGYNAVTSKYSVYASNILHKDYNLTLMLAQAAAIVAYLPVGIVASKIGRKKTILGGVVMLAIAFGVAAFLNSESPTMLMNAMFCLAGIGWATINVNSFPMVVEMCSGSDVGRYTGFYYTASMAAQVITPMFSGFLMDKVGMTVLFPYAALFVAGAFVTMLFVRHGDSRPIAAKGLEALDVDD